MGVNEPRQNPWLNKIRSSSCVIWNFNADLREVSGKLAT
jgi:hypothetical protein